MSTTKKLWLFFTALTALLLITVIPVWFWLASLQQAVTEIAPQRLEMQGTLQSILFTLAFIPTVGLLISIVSSTIIGRGIIRTEETLRITLSSIGDAVITTDVHGNVTYQNPIAESLTGWSNAEAKCQPHSKIFNIVNEYTRRKVDSPVDKVLGSGEIVGLASHTILIAKDGSEYSVDDSAAPILDQNGKMIGSVLIFRDITKQRQNEKLVEAARTYAENIVDTVREPLIVLNRDLHVQSANRSFFQSFKVRPEDVEFLPLYQLGDGQWDIPKLRFFLENVVQGGAELEDFEVAHDFPSIGHRVMKLNARKLRNESSQSELILLAIDDITLRKQAELERIRLASIVENSSDFIGISDIEGRPLFLNQAGKKLLGLSSSGDIHKTFPQDYIALEERNHFLNIVIPAVSRKGRWSGELTLKHFETGEKIPVYYDLFRIDDPQSGKPVNFATVTRDLTKQKQSEQERERLLREIDSERNRLFDVFQRAPSFMAVLSGEAHTFEIVNNRYRELVGHRDLIGLTVREALPEVSKQGFIELLNTVYTTGEAYVGKDVLIALERQLGEDPENRYVDFVFQAMRNADGVVTGVMVQGIDITERKKAEAAQVQYKILFENLPGMFLVLDPNYTIKAASNAYLKATMTERHEIIEQNIFDVFPDDPNDSKADGVQKLRRSLDRVRETHKTDVMAVQRYPTRTPDGNFKERFWSPVNSPVTSKDDSLFFIIHRVEDVTEYIRMSQQGDLPEVNKRTQMMAAEIVQRGHELQVIAQQLQEEERRFRTLVEQVKDYAIFMTDEKGLATTWNEGVYRVLGFTEDEFIGVDIVPTIFRAEDVANGVAQAELNEAALTGSASDDRWMKRKDGTHFWAAGVTTGLHSDDGQFVGFMKVMRDQTERKQLEEDLRASAIDLAESDRRKTEFLATLGHELRNPLAPICTGLEAMKLLENDPSAIAEIRATMERQLKQLIRLIDDLLDISRITHGKMELRKCRISLQEIIRSAVEAAKPFVDAAGHSLTVSAPEEPIVLDADPNRLAQVMSNLLNNATKYTPDGGNIRLSIEEDSSHAVISVQDNGLGIPEEMQDNIFEVFTQIDQPLEQGYSGLGIGLTLVKRLVELHGGTINVDSKGADNGSTFTVRLPIHSEKLAGGVEEDFSGTTTEPLRIVVVDDNQEAAAMLKEVLSILGNEVRIAFDGHHAINVVSEYLPDVVLMDIGMPKMNGYEAATHIRTQPYGKEVVLIALTGWGQDDDKRRTREAGFDFHLVKPTNLAELQQLLKKCKPKVTPSET